MLQISTSRLLSSMVLCKRLTNRSLVFGLTIKAIPTFYLSCKTKITAVLKTQPIFSPREYLIAWIPFQQLISVLSVNTYSSSPVRWTLIKSTSCHLMDWVDLSSLAWAEVLVGHKTINKMTYVREIIQALQEKIVYYLSSFNLLLLF